MGQRSPACCDSATLMLKYYVTPTLKFFKVAKSSGENLQFE